MFLSRDQILGATPRRVEELEVPEWGGKVYIRELTAAERDAFEATALERKGAAKLANLRARFVVQVLCDKEGARIFSDADASALGQKGAAAMDRIFEAASKLSRIGKDDLDDLEKNSEPTQSAG